VAVHADEQGCFLPSYSLLPTIASLLLLPCHDIPSYITCFEIARVEIARVEIACFEILIAEGKTSICFLVVLRHDW
jgi:hypothetical protein